MFALYWLVDNGPEKKFILPTFFVYSYPKHLSYISETIGILGWVVAGPSPNQFIRDAYNSGKHYADLVKVLQSGRVK